jgi:predicted GIY-YIG superfamily endonuclease
MPTPRRPSPSRWLAYLLRCHDGSLYTGITNDLPKRLKAHAAGKASKYTRSRLPVVLAYSVSCSGAPDGVVETSERQLATAANINKSTAGRALRRLTMLRLVWPIHKSTDKANQSRYWMHPNPAARLAAVMVDGSKFPAVCEKSRRQSRPAAAEPAAANNAQQQIAIPEPAITPRGS